MPSQIEEINLVLEVCNSAKIILTVDPKIAFHEILTDLYIVQFNYPILVSFIAFKKSFHSKFQFQKTF